MLKSIWDKILGLKKLVADFMTGLGKWKTGIVLLLSWAAYFVIGRALLSLSSNLVADVMEVAVNVTAALIKSVPYLVGLGLLLLTVVYVLDFWMKRKEQ